MEFQSQCSPRTVSGRNKMTKDFVNPPPTQKTKIHQRMKLHTEYVLSSIQIKTLRRDVFDVEYET